MLNRRGCFCSKNRTRPQGGVTGYGSRGGYPYYGKDWVQIGGLSDAQPGIAASRFISAVAWA